MKNLELKKRLPFEVKSISDEDPHYFYLEGYASTFDNVDLGNDVIEQGAFKASLQTNKHIPILWQHNMEEPIGITTEMQENDKGLFIKIQLPKEDTFVKGRVIPQIKIGAIKEMSIGFFVQDYYIRGDVRYLKTIELFETSLVTKAMNPQAKITGFKAVKPTKELGMADRETTWDSVSAIKRVREYSSSQDAPSPTYKNYFLYYDEENEDAFGAYKLPFVDIIDGKPLIIPKAVFAAAAALRGARGGVDLPEMERNRVINILNEFYSKMAAKFNDPDIISPFINGKSVAELESLREIETLLKNSGFSNTEAKTLISKIKEFANKRDAESKQEEQRDADLKTLLANMADLTNLIKSNKK